MLSFRRFKRIPLRDYLRVLDRDSDKVLGYLSNITIDGAQVVNTEPFSPGQEYRLSIELPPQLARCVDLEVEANIVWISPDRVPNFYDAGLRFGSLDAEEKRVIYELIAHYGMDDCFGFERAGAVLH